MHPLTEGYAHFGADPHPHYAERFETLIHQQHPSACLITCSDSRAVPETILKPGEVFAIRNAGNLVPAWGEEHSGVTASVEYAVSALKVRHLVVCGHTGCGVMHQMLERRCGDTLPSITAWLTHAGPSSRWLAAILRGTSGVSQEHKLRLLTEANVIMQLAHVRQYPAVDVAITEGRLELNGWVYDVTRGEIHLLNQATGAFHPLPAGVAAGELSAAAKKFA